MKNQPKKDLALVVKKFSKKYSGRDSFAVKDVSFVVEAGEFHGFIGANGAGKTTTIKSLIGAYAKYEGEILIFGENNSKASSKAKIGYIPEVANFPLKMSTKRYLIFMAYLSGFSMRESKEFAKNQILKLGLENVANKSPNTFSSGQKKKVLLAQALIGNPDLIIMDEPAANLDPKARHDFFKTLKSLSLAGHTILMSSHILAELDEFVDAVTILDGGKIVYSGKTKPLTRNKNMEYRFLFSNKKSENSFKKYISKLKLKIRDGSKKDVVVSLLKHDNLKRVIKFICKHELDIKYVTHNKRNLQQIYDSFVKKGSIDTGIGKHA